VSHRRVLGCHSCTCTRDSASVPASSTAEPFPDQATYRATRPLQLVHSDVCGPIQADSKEDVKWYLITFIDDYSRFVWIAITDDKSGKTA
jgi:hypothetical protein